MFGDQKECCKKCGKVVQPADRRWIDYAHAGERHLYCYECGGSPPTTPTTTTTSPVVGGRVTPDDALAILDRGCKEVVVAYCQVSLYLEQEGLQGYDRVPPEQIASLAATAYIQFCKERRA